MRFYYNAVAVNFIARLNLIILFIYMPEQV